MSALEAVSEEETTLVVASEEAFVAVEEVTEAVGDAQAPSRREQASKLIFKGVRFIGDCLYI